MKRNMLSYISQLHSHGGTELLYTTPYVSPSDPSGTDDHSISPTYTLHTEISRNSPPPNCNIRYKPNGTNDGRLLNAPLQQSPLVSLPLGAVGIKAFVITSSTNETVPT